MIHRRVRDRIVEALERQAAVVLLGPRQVGKTTLAPRRCNASPAA
jgi:uncharacterized protein